MKHARAIAVVLTLAVLVAVVVLISLPGSKPAGGRTPVLRTDARSLASRAGTHGLPGQKLAQRLTSGGSTTPSGPPTITPITGQ